MTDEIKDSFKARFSTPLLGTYLSSLILFNWKIVLYTFGPESSEEKVRIIQGLIANSYWSLLYALSAALALCFAMPFLANKYEIYIETQNLKKLFQLAKVRRSGDVGKLLDTGTLNGVWNARDTSSDIEKLLSLQISSIESSILEHKERWGDVSTKKAVSIPAHETETIIAQLKKALVDAASIRVALQKFKDESKLIKDAIG